VKNGLLDIDSRRLHPHTPLYFSTVSVPFDYDPAAPEPKRFLAFLDELWPQETEAVDVLAEWFGYVISGRTNLQKMMLMIGPTRGGKGVLARLLTALIGKANVCGPTLSSFAGEFGLAPLFGKSLAIISDVRFSGKGGNVVVERLLSISGEDTLTINRKYREQIDTKMSTRMHLLSNEMLRLTDASGAIIGRFIVLILTRSWLGREDSELEPRLCAELPGILNFALTGLTRLNKNDGRFTEVPSAKEAIVAMRDLASPVAAFVRERCRLDAQSAIAVDDIYGVYKTWAEDNEYPRESKALFGRDLRAAFPSLRKQRRREATGRYWTYVGIGWRKDEDRDSEDLFP
jgi:putative DNA primase/helicase